MFGLESGPIAAILFKRALATEPAVHSLALQQESVRDLNTALQIARGEVKNFEADDDRRFRQQRFTHKANRAHGQCAIYRPYIIIDE